jgi:hypothetical protein
MAADGIDVDLDDLQAVTDGLGRFIADFEALGASTDAVQTAVGHPVGDGRLFDRVGDFESGWNGNREVILDSLDNVHAHLSDFIAQIRALDVELAKDGE